MNATQKQADLIADLWIENGSYLPTQRGFALQQAEALTFEAAKAAITALNAAKGWDAKTGSMTFDQWLYLSELEEYVSGSVLTPMDAPKTYAWADARIGMLKKARARMAEPAKAKTNE